MKAISIKQPWASLIAEGRKIYEIRSWKTNYRGPILICVSQKPKLENLPTGVMICVVDLVDIIDYRKSHTKKSFTDWLPNHYSWILENPRIVKQLPVKGQLGLFNTRTRVNYL